MVKWVRVVSCMLIGGDWACGGEKSVCISMFIPQTSVP